jgi:hypothetical protein
MNINTFFLNKLINASKSSNLDTKKLANASYLFADIIKVCGDENTQPVNSTNTALTDLFAKEIKPISENAINCTSEDLNSLSAFMNDFLKNSTSLVSTSGATQTIPKATVSKKQFILSLDGLQEFLSGLIQFAVLNQNENVKESITSLDGEETDFSKIDSATSLINSLQTNKSLNLTFKNGSDKINISLIELPEENIEAKISLDKLTSDFTKLDKNTNLLTSQLNKETDGKDQSANPPSVNDSSQQVDPGNIVNQTVLYNNDQETKAYKTEVVEIKIGEMNSDNKQTAKDQPAKDITTDQVKNVSDQNSNKNYFSSYKIFPLPQSTHNNSNVSGVEFFNAGFRIKENAATLDIKDSGQKIIAEVNKRAISAPLVENITHIAGNEDQSVLNTKQVQTAQQNNSPMSKTDISAAADNAKQIIDNAKVIISDVNELLKSLNGSIDSVGLSKSSTTQESVSKVKLDTAEFSEELKNSGSVKISMPKELKIEDIKISSGNSTQSNEEEKPNQLSVKNELKSGLEEKLTFQTSDSVINTKGSEANKTVAEKSSAQFAEENNSKPGLEINPAKSVTPEKITEMVSDNSKSKLQAESQVQGIKNTTVNEVAAPKVFEKDDQSKIIKDSDDKNSLQNDAVKKDQYTVKETQSKSTDDKDFTKQKSQDNIKSILHGTEAAQNTDAERFKISIEPKNVQEPAKVIRPSELVPEISKFIQQGDKQSISFQLSPENLGKVKLMVEIVNSQVNTRIEVENSQVRQFVQSNIDQLKQSLDAAGIHLSNVNVSVADSDKRSQKGTGKKKQEEKNSRVESKSESTGKAQKSLGYNTYEFLA